MVGMLEAMSGIGLMMGFTGGSYVYEQIGFEMTYFTFGSILILIAIFTRIAFSCIDLKEDDSLTEPLISDAEILDTD